MAKRGFLARQGIVRNAVKRDLLYFAIPALLFFAAGVFISAWDGYEGLLGTIGKIVERPRALLALPVHSVAGLALIAVGYTVALIARGTLWKNYSSTLVIREDHQLITHGIYHYVRHPIYLGVILVCLGIPLSASSLFGLLMMLALIPVILCRIRIEESLLIEEFGDAYQAYRDSTSKLIPFIY